MAKQSPKSAVPKTAEGLAQAAKQERGEAFHDVVSYVLGQLLKGHGIHVVRMKNRGSINPFQPFVKDPAIASDLLNRIRLPLKRPCDQSDSNTFPDSDIVIIREVMPDVWRILSIVNCKVSFRDRHIQACFWGLAFKQHTDIRYFVVTLDAQRELGNKCGANEVRKRLETCTHGVFVMREFKNVQDDTLVDVLEGIKQQSKTDPEVIRRATEFDPDASRKGYCRMVKRFSDLITTLLNLQ